MPNIIERIKNRVTETQAPPATEVLEHHDAQPVQEGDGEPVVIVSHPNVVPVVIKQNLEATPMIGFTMETLANELGKVLEKSMQQACISSIEAEALGVFSLAGIVPKGFTLAEDAQTGKKFYVLNNSNRTSEIFKSLVKALNSTSSETISFPYVVDVTLELPLKFIDDSKDYEVVSVTTKSLYLTPKEITELNYAFIREIQFWGRDATVDDSIDLLALKVDREEWKTAPYRV